MKSAMRGFALAICFFLGTALLFSQKSELQMEADTGITEAQRKLGIAYCQGTDGYSQDYAKAIDYLTKAAQKNDIEAIRYVGWMYCKGVGLKKDETQALYWYLRGADLGDSNMQNITAAAYLGGRGAEKDIEKAIPYAEKSAAQGDITGYYILGECLSEESPKKNLANAFQCFVQAAYGDNLDARYTLATWYNTGTFVEKNPVMAYAWALLASNDDQEVTTLRDNLKSRLKGAEIDDAYHIVADFHSNQWIGRGVETPIIHFPDHEKHIMKWLFVKDHILIPVDIGNRKGLIFAVDTGASGTMIDTKLADELHLSKGLAQNISVVGMYHFSIYHTKCEKISIGDIQISRINPVIVSLDGINSVNSHPISGIIGNDILSQCVVTIDYPHHSITWQLPEDFKENEDHGVPIKVYFMRNSPMFESRFKNHDVWSKPTPVMVDTGAGGSIDLDENFMRDNPDLKLNLVKPTKNMGLGGEELAQQAISQSFELTPSLVIPNPILTIAQKTNGATNTIGAKILSKFDVTLDFSRKRIFLKPNEDFAKPFKPYLGEFGYKEMDDPRGKVYKIYDILENSDSTKAGLQKDDVIIQVNDVKGDKLNYDTLQEALSTEGPCTLVIERGGKQQTIQLDVKNPFKTPAH